MARLIRIELQAKWNKSTSSRQNSWMQNVIKQIHAATYLALCTIIIIKSAALNPHD